MKKMSDTRSDFPILSRRIHEQPLAYLDSAATAQKPRSVLKAIVDYYENSNANVHRGAHLLSQEATDLYEGAREEVAKFIGAQGKNLVFTSGTTDAINLVASSWGERWVNEGDDILVTRMEHHSNFVPWQRLAVRKGARLRIVELTKDFRIDLDSFSEALKGRPKILSLALTSNTLGVTNPIREMAEMAKAKGARVVVDAAQSVGHMPVSVTDLGAIDFLAFSAHKMCGPTGTGALWIGDSVFRELDPYRVGGGMITRVGDLATEWATGPARFEAGTPNISGAVGMAAAVRYLSEIGVKNIYDHCQKLTRLALDGLKEISSVQVIGPIEMSQRDSVISFQVNGVHPHDMATFLDQRGVAVRAGHHCAQPLMAKLGITATCRASFYFYNTEEEVGRFLSALKDGIEFFRGGL